MIYNKLPCLDRSASSGRGPMIVSCWLSTREKVQERKESYFPFLGLWDTNNRLDIDNLTLCGHTSSLTSDHLSYFELFRSYFLQIFKFRQILTKTSLSRLATQNNLKTNQHVPMFSTTLTVIHKESSFNIKPTKILSDLGGRGLMADPSSPMGANILLCFVIIITSAEERESPCIMSVQYTGRCSVHWGMSLSTLEGVQYTGGIS